MTLASFLNDHKRALGLMLLTVLLHIVVIDWAGGRLAVPASAVVHEQVVQAQLQAPPPPLAQLPVPKAQAKPPARPAVKPSNKPSVTPRAAAPSAPPAEGQIAPLPDSLPAILPDTSPAAMAASAPVSAAADQQPVIPDTPPASAAPVLPAPPARPGYKVDVPPSAEMAMQVVRKQANANPSYGVGRIIWTAGAGHYRLQIEAGLDLLFTTLNLIDIQSDGMLGNAGIEPVSKAERRRGRSQTATHFNRGETPTITFSASSKSYPLAPGAQDTATVVMQLAGIGRADASQLKDNKPFEIQIGEEREATVFAFFSVGFENIETKLGTLRTWHVSRPPRPGSYSSQIDFWFAPALGWYPVQIRNTEANGAVTTQTVTTILTATSSSK